MTLLPRARAIVAAGRWLCEIAGVTAIAGAAALWWLPLGIAIAGVYLVIIANSGGGERHASIEGSHEERR